MDIAGLMDAIETSGFSRSAVARAAGFSGDYLRQIECGRRPLTRVTLTRARLAIRRLARGDGEADAAASAAYRMAVAYAARALSLCPAEVLDASPGRRATADPAWMAAARARRLALYIANIYMGVPQARLAEAAGMSKAAVSMALNALEDERDSGETEALLADIERVFAA
ncbi:hypothetical protein [Martelella sp.]|uniref:hypothetical protein n=1 Tax=Martelella sp. TaxID=1969699 RepID=UPI0025C5AC6A|nr:hypothetical protein [Martelella sp.]